LVTIDSKIEVNRDEYNVINMKSGGGRLWKAKLLKTCGAASVSVMSAMKKGFAENPTNKVLYGKNSHYFLRFHFENRMSS
jgi:hypothetical protein